MSEIVDSNLAMPVVTGGESEAAQQDSSASSNKKRPVEDTTSQDGSGGNAKNGATGGNQSSKKMKKKHMDPEVLAFRGLVQKCCKVNDLKKAMEGFDEAIAKGTRVEPQSYYNLLNLCDGLERGIHIGTPKGQKEQELKRGEEANQKIDGDDNPDSCEQHKNEEVDLSTRKEYAERVKKQMDKLEIPLVENAYTALIKLLCKTGDVILAEELILEAEKVQQCKPRLRMYSAMMQKYSEDGCMVESIKIWLRASNQKLVLTELEQMYLMKCATKTGNQIVMQRVLSDLSEDCLVPCAETRRSIVDWFRSPHGVSSGKKVECMDDIITLLREIKSPYFEELADIGPVQTDCTEGWVITEEAKVDEKTGVLLSGCLKDVQLRPVATSPLAWAKMKELNEEIVTCGKVEGDTSEFQGGRKGPKKCVRMSEKEQRQSHWRHFTEYLERRRKDRKIDVIIDGANVGYFATNFGGAPKHVDYNQIDLVVEHFRRENKSVLLVIHSRHFSKHMMPRQFEGLRRRWIDSGVLYATPPGLNDDWFWLHAALDSGPGTLVLTNDEMRDHHFQMLAPRSFLRWKERHQIHFDFGPWIKGENCRRSRRVLLTYPSPYSRRIQRVKDSLVVPLPKRGDEKRFLDGYYEAPDDSPDSESYLCIRPNCKI